MKHIIQLILFVGLLLSTKEALPGDNNVLLTDITDDVSEYLILVAIEKPLISVEYPNSLLK